MNIYKDTDNNFYVCRKCSGKILFTISVLLPVFCVYIVNFIIFSDQMIIYYQNPGLMLYM